MKKIIGIMGASKANTKEMKLAYNIGKIIARSGAILLSGGMSGVMEASCKGAKEADGMVLAICPVDDKSQLNQYVDIPVMTGMKGGRNYMNILSSDIIISVGHVSAGTLSEIAFAIQLGKPLIIVGSSKKTQVFLKELAGKAVVFLSSVKEVEFLLESYLK